MGRRKKRIIFNKTLDVDFASSFREAPDKKICEILSKEQLERLDRIKKTLPTAPESVRLAGDLAKLSDSGPFLLLFRNISYSAIQRDIEEFLYPIVPIKIAINNQSRLLRGQCLVKFVSKDDLQRALEKNRTYLLSRDVQMSIANEADASPWSQASKIYRSEYSQYSHGSANAWARRKTDNNGVNFRDLHTTTKTGESSQNDGSTKLWARRKIDNNGVNFKDLHTTTKTGESSQNEVTSKPWTRRMVTFDLKKAPNEDANRQ